MSEPAPRYVFDPLDRRGLIAGLRTGQVVVLGVGVIIATATLRSAGPGLGVLLALASVTIAVAVAFVPVAGQSAEQWAPAVTRRAVRLATQRTRTAPARVLPFGRGIAGRAQPELPRRADGLGGLAGIRIDEVVEPGGVQIGLIRDRAQRSVAAVLSVRARSFALLDPADKARRLGSWSGILAGLAREGGPVRCLQWVERTVPGDAAALVRHLDESGALAPTDPRALSYADLVSEAGPLGQHHECFIVLSVRARSHAREAQDVLLRELRLLQGQLRSAEIDVAGVLGAREIGAVWRRAFDPWIGAHPTEAGVPPELSWPMATDEAWSSWRTDRTWHATFWIAEWPRRDVGPDFLAPLLLHVNAQRTLSLLMGPLPPSTGIREVESARTAHAADEQLRQRAGFLSTARRLREAEGAARREAELADGHAAYRFSGYLTVTAQSESELEDACGEVVQAGHQCRVDLRRLYGIQDLAFAWTLPLGRGLAGRR